MMVFMRWWLDGIMAAMPGKLKSFLTKQKKAVLLRMNTDLSIVMVEGGGNEEAQCDINHDLQLYEFSSLLKKIVKDKNTGILQIPNDRVLYSHLNFPLSARDRLSEIMPFEIERQTPFSLDEVYFAFDAEVDEVNDRVSVTLALVPKKDLASQLNRLAVNNIAISQIQLGDKKALTLFLEKNNRKNEKAFNRVLWLSVICLFIVALYLPSFLLDLKIDEIKEQIKTNRVAAVQSKKLGNAIKERKQQLGFIQYQFADVVYLSEVINEVSGVLDNDAWLERLEIKQNKLKLRGHAVAAETVISPLESSPVLANVKLSSRVSFDKKTSTEKFAIEADIVRE